MMITLSRRVSERVEQLNGYQDEIEKRVFIAAAGLAVHPLAHIRVNPLDARRPLHVESAPRSAR